MNFESFVAFQKTWRTLSPEYASMVEKIKTSLLVIIEKKNETDINSGRYDSTVSVSELVDYVVVTFPSELQGLIQEMSTG